MKNTYIENLINKIRDRQQVTSGENALAKAFDKSSRNGFEVFTLADVIWERDVEDFVSALRSSGLNELYIVNQASNMLEIYLMFDKLGLKLRGITSIENALYKKEMARWGMSGEKESIPAFKLSFEEV